MEECEYNHTEDDYIIYTFKHHKIDGKVSQDGNPTRVDALKVYPCGCVTINGKVIGNWSRILIDDLHVKLGE